MGCGGAGADKVPVSQREVNANRDADNSIADPS
jgi:hypothetical protein